MSAQPEADDRDNALAAAAQAAGLLSHTLRVRMLTSWPEGQRLSVRTIALGLDCRLSYAVYHLRVLADGGAIELVDESPAGEAMFRLSAIGRRLGIAAEVLTAAVGSHASAAAVAVEAETGAQERRERGGADVQRPAATRERQPAEQESPVEEEALAPVAAARRRSRRAEELLQLIRRRPGVTVREASEQLGTERTTLYGPLRRLVDEGTVTRDGVRLVPVTAEVRVRPGSWAARVLSRLHEAPGQTVGELSTGFELPPKSTLLYPPIRTLLAQGAIARDGSRLYPVVL